MHKKVHPYSVRESAFPALYVNLCISYPAYLACDYMKMSERSRRADKSSYMSILDTLCPAVRLAFVLETVSPDQLFDLRRCLAPSLCTFQLG